MTGLLRSLAIPTLALTLSLALAHPNVAAAEPADDKQFDEGTKAMREKNWPLAYERFADLWRRKQSLDIAANLALTEEQLGKTRDAAEHLGFALSVLPETADPAVRERMQTDLTALEAKVGRISIQCAAGSTITIGEKVVGITPIKTIYVDPGQVVVTATHPEKGKATTDVTVRAGGATTVSLALVPGDSTGADKKPIWPALLLGGVAAAGVGVGIGLTVAAFGQRSDAVDQAQLCSPFTANCQTAADSDLDSANGLLGGGIAALGIGGAALAGMAIYLAVPQSSEQATAVLPWFAPDGAGLTMTTSF